ncbi:hypothetical protein CWR43_15885 [Rhizobium sullae]|uniref:Uncharacterized protein n=1 Tax=Rhizobium sullae TaxID=50338 RepID=A0A2N0D909_RHISU|nr:hypothetical protein CWR43_15885 [Rhizobium sullae]
MKRAFFTGRQCPAQTVYTPAAIQANTSFLTELRERPRFGLTRAAGLTIEPQLSNYGLLDCRPAFVGASQFDGLEKQE